MPKQTLSARMLALTAKRRPGPKCGTCLLPPDVLKELNAAKSSGATNTAIFDVLQEDGHTITRSSVDEHFRKQHHVAR